jgi:hypothetical protein
MKMGQRLSAAREIGYVSIQICASSRPAAAHARQPKEKADPCSGSGDCP